MELLTSRIVEREVDGMRLFALRTATQDVVTIEGSVRGGDAMLPRSLRIIPSLASDLFDAGTKQRSKEVIRGSLSSRGATLSFYSQGARTYFSGTCLPEDLNILLRTLSECLSEATFPAHEVKLAKERGLGELEEARTETKTQAAKAMSRSIYDAAHANYADSTAEEIKKLSAATRSDLLEFKKCIGKNGLVIALVGDIDPSTALSAAVRSFSRLPAGTTSLQVKPMNSKPAQPGQTLVHIPNKANIDTYIGIAVPITYENPLYLPLTTFASMLGGRGLSTGHLMRTIRERDGYTYGIYAQPTGFDDGQDGYLRIWATFSPPTFEKAVAATKREMQIFLDVGMTEDSLETKKGEITGNYQVSLSTTRGLAATLHKIGREGKALSYIDEYPELIRTITLTDIKHVANFFPVKKLYLAASGSFAK